MTIKETALRVVEALESLQVPYMLVGSLSSSSYGIPRSTQDADFVVQLQPDSINRIMEILGPCYTLDPQMSFETVTATTRYKLLLPNSAFTVELFLLGDDAHDQERFSRRIQRETMGRSVWLPTAEDVVIMKLRWSKQGRRNKDVDDVKNVLRVQGDALDWPYIYRWCDEHGTRDLLDQIRRSTPKD